MWKVTYIHNQTNYEKPQEREVFINCNLFTEIDRVLKKEMEAIIKQAESLHGKGIRFTASYDIIKAEKSNITVIK